MGFFVVGRVAEDGSLDLISTKEFSTRQAAIDELSTMAVDASLESEVFVVDLDVATPVLLVRQQPVETPMDTEPQVELEKEPEAETESADDLADALRRATDALEDEGIEAPESVGLPESAVQPESVDSPEDTSPQEDDESWPWAKEETDAKDAEDQPEGYVLDSLEEPSAADDEGILVHAKGDEDTIGLSRPVVMGEYGTSEDAVADEQQDSQDEIPLPPPADEEPLPSEPSLPRSLEEAPPPPPPVAESEPEPEPTQVSAAVEDASILADLEIPISPNADAKQEYAGEEIDLASLTCADCVYVNTCPNKEDLQPGDCGSFQWKSS